MRTHYVITAGLDGLYCPNVIELAATPEQAGEIYIETVERQTDGLCDCADEVFEQGLTCSECEALTLARQAVEAGKHTTGHAVTYRNDYDATRVYPCDCPNPADHIDPSEWDPNDLADLLADLILPEGWTVEHHPVDGFTIWRGMDHQRFIGYTLAEAVRTLLDREEVPA